MTSTTLTMKKIRATGCLSDLEDLAHYVNYTLRRPEDTPVSLTEIRKAIGAESALWCIQAIDDSYMPIIRKWALHHVVDVKHILSDKRSLRALETAEQYVSGKATDDDLAAAFNEAANVVHTDHPPSGAAYYAAEAAYAVAAANSCIDLFAYAVINASLALAHEAAHNARDFGEIPKGNPYEFASAVNDEYKERIKAAFDRLVDAVATTREGTE